MGLPFSVLTKFPSHNNCYSGGHFHRRPRIEKQGARAARQDVFHGTRHFAARGPNDLAPRYRQAPDAAARPAPDPRASGSWMASASDPYTRSGPNFSAARWNPCMFKCSVTQAFSGKLGQHGRLVDAVLGHVAIGGPFAAGNGQQAGLIDVDGVVARKRRRVSAAPRSSPADECLRIR